MTPKRKIQIAAVLVFALATAAANLVSPFTPIWIAGVIAVSICALCGFGLVGSVAWSMNDGLEKWESAGAVAFFCFFAITSVVRLPPELDSDGLGLAAIFGNESMDRQASIAKAAQKALQSTTHEGRQANARGVYLLSGAVIDYRDERDQVQPFVPDEKARKLVEAALSTQATVKVAINDHLHGGLSRSVVKLLSILAFVLTACVSTVFWTGPRD